MGESESSDHDSSSSSEKEAADNDPDGSKLDHATAGPPFQSDREIAKNSVEG